MAKEYGGNKVLKRPPEQAGSFPEREYTESLKGEPPSSEYAKAGTPNQTGPNAPSGGAGKSGRGK